MRNESLDLWASAKQQWPSPKSNLYIHPFSQPLRSPPPHSSPCCRFLLLRLLSWPLSLHHSLDQAPARFLYTALSVAASSTSLLATNLDLNLGPSHRFLDLNCYAR